MANWLSDMTEDARERVFVEMRKMRAVSDSFQAEHRRLKPSGTDIPVGGGHMDPFFRSEGLASFLGALGRGMNPQMACAAAKADVAHAVGKWNGRREYQVHRAPSLEDSNLEDCMRRVLRAADGT